MRLPRRLRLTGSADLARVRAEGKRLRTAHLEGRVGASLQSFPRVGVIVAKHKHNSVERNLLKRRLRELLRTAVVPGMAPVDLVVRTAPGAYALTFEALRAEVAQLAAKLPKGPAA